MYGYVPEDLDNQVPSEGSDDASWLDDSSEPVSAGFEWVIEGGPEILTAGLPPWTGETWGNGTDRWAHLEAGWNSKPAAK
ncbi:hypothetical protein Caci_2953 [Catenulispora acidiphila DSM 44928]|uniref:Uncharacterized protein n=1 Tax=Catenulispora acidiphila (strain DSM 44928 / JCM 14897 / NBRC 102108 / NRRL B-24433 / ID139908) TaxID=479433 RepID=C7Q2X0_CATAD|nr:hypothetical protein [Catenulispora acidiphila]ACU71862.1 hypothetical protein Caci_2953 [Catenulispora acidiphila DSM 44928]